jgi:hypothetical protein
MTYHFQPNLFIPAIRGFCQRLSLGIAGVTNGKSLTLGKNNFINLLLLIQGDSVHCAVQIKYLGGFL